VTGPAGPGGAGDRGTAAVVLAAGASRRFTGPTPKLLAPFRGRPLVHWALEHAVAAGLAATVVVTGAVDLAPVLPETVTAVHNDHWADGQASSLQAAVRWAQDRGLEAVVVGLGDQPLVPPAAWRAVAGAGSPIAVALYQGHRAPPTRLAATVWPLLPTEGDQGARVTMARHPHLVQEVACPGQPIDIDTVEDLARWS
jgi:molybdenum cofactor cytidylyltransferase